MRTLFNMTKRKIIVIRFVKNDKAVQKKIFKLFQLVI